MGGGGRGVLVVVKIRGKIINWNICESNKIWGENYGKRENEIVYCIYLMNINYFLIK